VFGSGGMDFNEVLRDSRERMAKVTQVRERMAELTGSAESSDGRVKVVCTSTDPLAELHIDPRAMRMGSEELAATIRQLSRQAREDLDRQVDEITKEAYGEDDNPMELLRNREELKQNLTEMQGMFEKAGNDAQAMIDQLRRGLGIKHPGAPQ
jgi:DNA-binding protein YbaB